MASLQYTIHILFAFDSFEEDRDFCYKGLYLFDSIAGVIICRICYWRYIQGEQVKGRKFAASNKKIIRIPFDRPAIGGFDGVSPNWTKCYSVSHNRDIRDRPRCGRFRCRYYCCLKSLLQLTDRSRHRRATSTNPHLLTRLLPRLLEPLSCWSFSDRD